MKIFGYDHNKFFYELSIMLGGFGVGIIISNTFRLSFIFGLTISVIGLIFSIYFWNMYEKVLHKNLNSKGEIK